MARLVRGMDYGTYMEISAHFRGDRSLSSRSMRAYLHYRLHMLNAEIDSIADRLDLGEELDGYWPRPLRPMSDEMCASWTSLTYLLNARDALRETLDTLDRRGN
jgi:hypothetical protein